MRPILAIAAIWFVAQCVLPTQAHAGMISQPAAQVGDFLNAVKSAVSGKRSKRRRRRARGSNKPILASPPAPPIRRPGDVGDVEEARSTAQSNTTSSTIAVVQENPTRKRIPSPKVKLRTALIAVAPADKPTVAVPTRRPTKPRKYVSATPATVETNEALAEDIPPPPTTWDAKEISSAYDRCDALLAKLTVTIEPVEPMRKGPCGTPAPVRLSALGEAATVTVKPAATLNCKTVAQIHKWIEQKVQPAANKIFQSEVARIRNASSYACRNRNNAKTGKLSEHALGNALDVSGFVLADGRAISVLRDWGPVQRDIDKGTANSADQVAIRTSKKKQRKTKAIPQATVIATAKIDNRMTLPVFKGPVRRGVRLNRVPDPGGPPTKSETSDQIEPRTASAPPEQPKPSAKSRFLKQVHADACGIFGTVLGPEANDAHRDHFHFDTAERTYRAYCR